MFKKIRYGAFLDMSFINAFNLEKEFKVYILCKCSQLHLHYYAVFQKYSIISAHIRSMFFFSKIVKLILKRVSSR